MVADSEGDGSRSRNFRNKEQGRESGARRKEAMKARTACASLLSDQGVAEAAWESGDAHVQSTATQRPRPRAVRARGASPLPFRLSARPSPRAPWARGLLSAFWERGSPDLPACCLRRGSKGGPARPIFINTDPRPSRGAKPHGADDTELPQARPHRVGLRGGGEIKAGYLTRCP